MRLTLRTLLAYIDDILEPAQASEIGAKIAEHPDAAKLMKRVREVLRRRRVGSPALAGPGSGPDPNVVAEYLDNTLPPALVLELERLCLESDVHLAEVAGSHKILSLVLSEPVDVPIDMRERMYVLGNVPRPAPVKLPEKALEERGNSPGAVGETAHYELQERLFSSIDVGEMTDGIPEYLRKKSVWKRWAGVAVGAALIVGWLCLVLFDPAYRPGKRVNSGNAGESGRVAANEGPQKLVEAKRIAAVDRTAKPGELAVSAGPKIVPESGTQAAPAPAADDRGTETSETGTSASPGTDAVAETNEATSPAEKEPAVEPAAPMPPTPIDDSDPAGEVTPAGPDAVAVAAPGEAAAPQENAVAPAAPPARAMYTSTEGVLLVESPTQTGWMVSPRRAMVHEGESLAVPEPYVADLLLTDPTRNEAVLELALQGGTRVSLIPAQGRGVVGMEVHRGRVKLARPPASGEAVSVLVRVGGRNWELELTDPGTVCGLAVDLPQPAGPPGEMGPMKIGGGILVVSGAIGLESDENALARFQAGEGVVPWAAPGTPLAAQLPGGLPDWLTPDGAASTPTARHYARTFEKEFSLEHPASVSIPPVIKDRQAKIAELAVRTVSLLEGYKDLASALHSEHEEARLAAIEGLREWLPQGPENADLLRQELAHYFQEEQIDVIVRLLWGYSIQDAHDPATSEQLVTWMADNDITIRELAFYHVYRLTGRRDGYRPNLPVSFRQAAVMRWQEQVKRTGALLSD